LAEESIRPGTADLRPEPRTSSLDGKRIAAELEFTHTSSRALFPYRSTATSQVKFTPVR